MKETKLPYTIKFKIETEQERMFLRIALQKAQSCALCALCAILDTKNDSELSESMKQFNLESLKNEYNLYARLQSHLDDATDEAEPWRTSQQESNND